MILEEEEVLRVNRVSLQREPIHQDIARGRGSGGHPRAGGVANADGIWLEPFLIRLNGVVDRRMDHGKVEERRRPGWTSSGEDRIRRDHVQLGDWVGSRGRCPHQTTTNDEAGESSEPCHGVLSFSGVSVPSLHIEHTARDVDVIDERRFVASDRGDGRIAARARYSHWRERTSRERTTRYAVFRPMAGLW